MADMMYDYQDLTFILIEFLIGGFGMVGVFWKFFFELTMKTLKIDFGECHDSSILNIQFLLNSKIYVFQYLSSFCICKFLR